MTHINLFFSYKLLRLLFHFFQVIFLIFYRWRIIKEEDNNSTSEVCNDFEDYDNEDISDEMYVVNHDRALLEERKKFETFLKFPLTSRSRANRRIDSRGNESSGANTPIIDPTTPPPGEFEVITKNFSSFSKF